jgi:hypothetical protein
MTAGIMKDYRLLRYHPVDCCPCFEGTRCLHLQGTSEMMLEREDSSKMLMKFYQPMWYHIPEDKNLYSQ